MSALDVIIGVFSMFVPASVLAGLLFRRLMSRDLGVTSWHDKTKNRYVFAFANNEEVGIEAKIELKLTTLSVAGRIVSCTLLCGPRELETVEAPVAEASVWTAVLPRMRPLATWLVECETNGAEGDLEFTVTIAPRPEERPSLVTLGRRPPQQKAKLGVAMRGLATLGALGVYVGDKVGPWHAAPISWRNLELDQIDLVMMAIILLAGLVTIVIMRQGPQPPVFGYVLTGSSSENTTSR